MIPLVIQTDFVVLGHGWTGANLESGPKGPTIVRQHKRIGWGAGSKRGSGKALQEEANVFTSSVARRTRYTDDSRHWSTSRILRELQSMDPFARGLALKAGLYNPNLAIANRAQEMLHHESVERNRIDLIRLIGVAGDRRHIRSLCPFLRDETPAIRYASLNAIATVGDPSLSWAHVVGLTDPIGEIRKLCNAILASLGPRRVTRLLAAMLASKRKALRLAAVKAAGKMRGAPASAFVRKATKDSDPTIRHHARIALQKIVRHEIERSQEAILRQEPNKARSLDDTHPSAPVQACATAQDTPSLTQ